MVLSLTTTATNSVLPIIILRLSGIMIEMILWRKFGDILSPQQFHVALITFTPNSVCRLPRQIRNIPTSPK